MMHAVLTTLGKLPITVPAGPLRGLRWTLYPATSYWRGHHEPAVVDMFKNAGLKPGMVFWDAGAHFGFYALWMARLLGPGGQVAAFEPNPSAYAKLDRHQQLNRFSQLKIFPFALSDQDGFGELIDADEPGTTAHFRYHNEPPPRSTTSIPTRRIDSLAADLRLRDPDWIKMDVEGHAGAALQGARACLVRARPSLLIATHGDAEIDAIRSILQPMGYRVFDLSDAPVPWECLVAAQDYVFLP